MDLQTLLAPIAADLAAVNQVIRDRLSSQVALINDVSAHIIHSGGKRLRPATTLLAAGAAGKVNANAQVLAAVVELIHTATLLHDDVVDHTELRRGRLTANAQWNSSAAVLSGDFLYSRAFQMMVDVGLMPVMREMADVTNAVAEGEVLQLLNARNPEVTEASYLKVIELKTAVLFRAAATLGAIATAAEATAVEALARYGHALGMAYQLADDMLDFTGSPEQSGKAIGNDLAEGKPTLPLIRLMQQAEPAFNERMKQVIRSGDMGNAAATLAEVQSAIAATAAIAYTHTRACEYSAAAVAALQGLPDTPARQALEQLAQFAISRKH